jgi:DNA-binding phage protein
VSIEEGIRVRFDLLGPALNERQRRLWAAAESKAIGRGGITLVARTTGLSRRTIHEGAAELGTPAVKEPMRVRRQGGGRKRAVEKDPGLLADLERLVDPLTRGDPESPLRWTCKSLRKLSEELGRKGHQVSHTVVGELLHGLKYSLQANSKTTEGSSHPDRNAQFEHINQQAVSFLEQGLPAISVDTKKKELVGDFKNGGREWQPQGQPERVRVHDFKIPALGKDIPYGVYDLGRDAGWVNVGTDHDTAAFAVESIRQWWRAMGQASYPKAEKLLITADSGGSNGARVRLWKLELQKFADETGLAITVSHFPPGTSKWNKIEHRLFSFITLNWRGKPLISHEVIVELIAGTTTQSGLKVKSRLDTGKYPKGVKVGKKEFASIDLQPDSFHGDWNYTIMPRRNVSVIS